MKKWSKLSAGGLGFLIAVSRFLWVQNKDIYTREVTYESPKIPKSFNNFKITQVTDFHNTYYGRGGKHLLKKVKDTAPDIILVTGDLIDRRTPNEARGIKMLKDLMEIAPCYYVTGNHEAFYKNFLGIYEKILNTGVHNASIHDFKITRGKDAITITGIHDLRVLGDLETNPSIFSDYDKMLEDRFKNLNDNFTVLLAHRPEEFERYSKYPVDLIFSGHAHGGQIRLPVVKGLYAPDQGILPTYTEGTHTLNESTLLVSRGLGNSRFPWRVFNKPEIISVTLKSK